MKLGDLLLMNFEELNLCDFCVNFPSCAHFLSSIKLLGTGLDITFALCAYV